MNDTVKPRHGGRVVVDLLAQAGISKVFSVPGESFLPVLDALHDHPDIELVSCRHEGGASMMAEAYAKATGRPTACFVTRGPGASNAVSGLYVAAHDSTPLLLFVGQVPRALRGRGAWQEVDLDIQFSRLAKWAADIDDPARIPEYVSRAFHVATSGRPGPVALGLPEDVLYADQAAPGALRPLQATRLYPGEAELARLQAWVEEASRPLMLVGGAGWSPDIQKAMQAFAERNALPVAASFRRQDYIDNTHPNYAGEAGIAMNPALARRIEEADLLLTFGARLGDVPTRHYTLVKPPRPHQRLVHVHADAGELGRVYQPDLAICADSAAFASALGGLQPSGPPVDERRASVEAAHRDYLAWSNPESATGGQELAQVVSWLAEELPPEAAITNGAGNYTLWLHRYYRHRRHGSQFAPTSGSMGYGLPAAIAAGLAHPERPVICFAGDGCLLMTSQELATAAHYGVKVIVVLVNNGIYGSIRMHQQRRYPGRPSGTALTNPDFAMFARAFGMEAYRADDAQAFRHAFRQALDGTGSALIEMAMDPETLTPGSSPRR